MRFHLVDVTFAMERHGQSTRIQALVENIIPLTMLWPLFPTHLLTRSQLNWLPVLGLPVQVVACAWVLDCLYNWLPVLWLRV